MKKVFGQTVRDLKRGVNKKVLKVPTIEQKVLDCTSNEPWGPHGTLLTDIAQATRNYHEYQMIMSVLWKRTNDTGKNWRHVYKALTVLEYLVAHGSERVIDDIREHIYQLQVLSDFQYIDSGGRDQGSNVRKKSQGLVALVNDKERILEVREKAASNREKIRNTEGGMYPPGSSSPSSGHGDRYDDDRYGGREDERNASGRGREYGYKGDDRYAYGRDGDRYGREYAERFGGDDGYRGRSRSVDNHSSRGRSSDGDKYEDDDQYSSRGSEARADEQSRNGRSFNHKFAEQNFGAPPSYEEVISGAQAAGATDSPTHSERDGETSRAAPERSSLTASSSPTQVASTSAPTPAPNLPAEPAVNENGADGFDEFDPRGSHSAAPTTSNGAAPTKSVGGEMDLLGSLSDSFSGNPLASVSTSGPSTNQVSDLTNSGSTFTATSAPSMPNQGFDDLFGDGPFKAIPSSDGAEGQQQQGFGSMSFQNGFNQGPVMPQQVSQGAAEGSFAGTNSTPFGASNVQSSQGAAEGFFSSSYSTPFGMSNVQPSQGAPEGSYSTPFGASNGQPPSAKAQYQQHEFSTHDPSIDILADILPPTGPQPVHHPETGYAVPVSQGVPQFGFLVQTGQDVSPTFSSQSDPTPHQSHFSAQSGQPSSARSENQATFASQSGPTPQQSDFPAQSVQPSSARSENQATFSSESGPTAQQTGFSAESGHPTTLTGFQGQHVQPSSARSGNQGTFSSQSGPTAQQTGFSAQSGHPTALTGFQGQHVQPSSARSGNQGPFSSHSGPTAQQTGFSAESGHPTALTGFHGQHVQPSSARSGNQGTFSSQSGPTAQQTGFSAESGHPTALTGFQGQHVQPSSARSGNQGPFSSQSGPTAQQTGFSDESGHPTASTGFQGQHVQPSSARSGNQGTFSSQSGPTAQQTGFSAESGQPTSLTGFQDQHGQLVVHPNFPSQFGQAGFAAHGGQPQSSNGYLNQATQAPQTGFSFQMNQSQQGGFQSHHGGQAVPPNPVPYSNYNMQTGYGYGAHVGQNMAPQVVSGLTSQQNATNSTVSSQMPYSTGQVGSSASSQSDLSAPVPSTAPQRAKDKQFETKSTVWADTLSRGLVNLDISGVKTNPLSDIGIDFDSINRKEKRMEKPTTTPVTSTIHMGKAMGSGTGMGRAGAGAIRPPPNPTMGAGMDTGMGGPRPGVGMGGYGGMNQQPMGMGGPRPGVGMGGYGGMNQQATGGYGGMNQQTTGGYGGMNQQATGGYGGMNQQAMGGYGGTNQQAMGGYGGMNQQAMGGGMGMNMQPNMGMGHQNMGMRHPNMNMGGQMQHPTGFPPGSNMQGGYNPNMGGQMQQPAGFPPGSNMQQGGYNPNMGSGNYGQNQNQHGGGF